MLKKIILAFLGLFLWACDFDMWEIKEPSTEEKNEATPQISIKKNGKVAKALDFLNEVFGEPNLRFEKSNIEKIYEFPDKEKRNCLKLVAFKKEGYALISNIKNVENPPVLLYNKGKFDPKNPNPGLVAYMEEFTEKAARDPKNALLPGAKKNKKKKKSDISKKNLTRRFSGGTSGSRNDYIYRNGKSGSYPDVEKAPLLKTNWYQSGPYNNTIEKHKDKGTKLGCVTVAVGQIIAYHKKDKHYPNDYDWSKIHTNLNRETYETPISEFLWGIATHVIAIYGTDYSMGTHERAAYYFEDAGFKTSGWRYWSPFTFDWQYVSSDYDYNTVTREIDEGRPVYLSGWSGILGAHAWVADGYKKVHFWTSREVWIRKPYIHYPRGLDDYEYLWTDYKSYNYNYIHMNWGWGYSAYCTYDHWYVENPKKPYDNSKVFRYLKGMITVKKRH